MPSPLPRAASAPTPGPVVTRAALRAAERLGISARTLAAILGVSEATLSRMKKGEFALDPKSKAFEIAVLFIRMFRSLDAIVGGDEGVSRRWLAADNRALNGKPAEKIASISGLIDVIAYLDARRAVV